MSFAAALARRSREAGVTVSVCLPARNEEQTVGAIVSALVDDLVDRTGLVSEVVVVDDHSDDATACVAARAGARVVSAAHFHSASVRGPGKGAALWKSMFVTTGDVVCWIDADLSEFDTSFVPHLVAPLLDGSAGFAKGHYRRNGGHSELGGGRVTELVARPLLARLLPELASFPQPLAGEYAGLRAVLERLPFERGWGVDVGLLADAVALLGRSQVASVDLGARAHKHRPLVELVPQAEAILDVVLARAGIQPGGSPQLPPPREVREYRIRTPGAWSQEAV